MGLVSARSAWSNFMGLGDDRMYTLRREDRTKAAEEAIQMFILENGNAKRKGLFLPLFQLQNETSTTSQQGNMKWPSVCPHGLPSLFQMIKCMVVGSSWSDNWNISDYGASELLLESGKQKCAKQHCQADMLALWIHGCWMDCVVAWPIGIEDHMPSQPGKHWWQLEGSLLCAITANQSPSSCPRGMQRGIHRPTINGCEDNFRMRKTTIKGLTYMKTP